MTPAQLHEQLEFRRVAPDLERPLAEFFAALVSAGDDRTFHPHPFTPEAARERALYQGKDVYCLAVVGSRVLGYGMLRGWDEGYDIPSLGIAILSTVRGIGLGRALMQFLHAEARRRGAQRVRLSVYPDNTAAIALYRSLGYQFEPQTGPSLIGFKALRDG